MPADNETGIMGMRFVICDAVPKDSLMILSPQYVPGGLDLEATLRASVTLTGLKIPVDKEDGERS